MLNQKADQSSKLTATMKETIQGRFSRFGKYANLSFGLGLLAGILIASTAFSGYIYWDSLDHRTTVPITVVTCDSCEYEKFKDATDRMLKTQYREVDYRSEEGQKLIQEHNLEYVPGFIFEGEQLEKAGNFTSLETTLVDSGNAYVIPDEGTEVAQRLSEGENLNQAEAE